MLVVTGPCPDWDPEVVEALETAEIKGLDQIDQEEEVYFAMLVYAG